MKAPVVFAALLAIGIVVFACAAVAAPFVLVGQVAHSSLDWVLNRCEAADLALCRWEVRA